MKKGVYKRGNAGENKKEVRHKVKQRHRMRGREMRIRKMIQENEEKED